MSSTRTRTYFRALVQVIDVICVVAAAKAVSPERKDRILESGTLHARLI
jgi:hypothetical protein